MSEAEKLLLSLGGVFLLGIGAQWIAWRIRLPSILLLLSFGFLAGPVTGFVKSDELFGSVLFPIVSISVAIILFEGSLSLRIHDLREIGRALFQMLSIGALVTWGLITCAAHFILEMGFDISLLLGAILIVTGPTVIGPMLRYIRPIGKVSTLARWEGIIIDPIGAVLAVLVFEAIKSPESPMMVTVVHLVLTVGVGVLLGVLGALLVVNVLHRFWAPDHLHSPIVLMAVVGMFVLSNVLQEESGFITVTLMGILIANQQKVSVKHILEFKENISVVLISSLFILLAARLQLRNFESWLWQGPVFLAFVVLVVRPLAIFASTCKTPLTLREKIFLSWLAPRGIVAAAVSSVFALQLGNDGGLVSATFLVIVGTVAIYGLTASLLARRLGLSSANPQGFLIGGADPVARAIAKALQDAKFAVALVDTNREHVRDAKLAGLTAYHDNILAEEAVDAMDLGGIGKFLALTPNEEVNSLATIRFVELFGRAGSYRVWPNAKDDNLKGSSGHQLPGRIFADKDVDFELLQSWILAGGKIKRTSITDEFGMNAYKELYGDNAIPLFLISESGNIQVCTPDTKASPKPGQALLSLVRQAEDEPATF